MEILIMEEAQLNKHRTIVIRNNSKISKATTKICQTQMTQFLPIRMTKQTNKTNHKIKCLKVRLHS